LPPDGSRTVSANIGLLLLIYRARVEIATRWRLMAHYVELPWRPGDSNAQLSRRDKRPGSFQAYVPDELGTSLPELGADARDAAESALQTLSRADERIGAQGRFLSHLLIRSESISSSWIEGNRVTPKKLAIAEA